MAISASGRNIFSMADRIHHGLSASRAQTLVDSVATISLDQGSRDLNASSLKKPGDVNLVHHASSDIRCNLNQGGPLEKNLNLLVNSGKLGDVDLASVITKGQKLGGPELIKMQAVDSMLLIMKSAADAFIQEDGDGKKVKLTEQQQKLVNGQKVLEQKMKDIISRASIEKKFVKSVGFDRAIKEVGDKAVDLLNQFSPQGEWIEYQAEIAIKKTLECASLMESSTEIYHTADNMMLGASTSFEEYCAFRVALTTLPSYLHDGAKAEPPQEVEPAVIQRRNAPIPSARPPAPPAPAAPPAPSAKTQVMMVPMKPSAMRWVPVFQRVGVQPHPSDSITINISIDPSIDPPTTSTASTSTPTATAKKGADRQTSTDIEEKPNDSDWRNLRHVETQKIELETPKTDFRNVLSPPKNRDKSQIENKDEPQQSGAIKKDKKRERIPTTNITNNYNYITNHHHHHYAASANAEPPPPPTPPPPELPLISQLKGLKSPTFSRKPPPEAEPAASFTLRPTANGHLLWGDLSVLTALIERDPNDLDEDELVEMVSTALGTGRISKSKADGVKLRDPDHTQLKQVLIDYMLVTDVNPLTKDGNNKSSELEKKQAAGLSALTLLQLLQELRDWAEKDNSNSSKESAGPSQLKFKQTLKINYAKNSQTLRKNLPSSVNIPGKAEWMKNVDNVDNET